MKTKKKKKKTKREADWPIAYPNFCSMKTATTVSTPPGWDASSR